MLVPHITSKSNTKSKTTHYLPLCCSTKGCNCFLESNSLVRGLKTTQIGLRSQFAPRFCLVDVRLQVYLWKIKAVHLKLSTMRDCHACAPLAQYSLAQYPPLRSTAESIKYPSMAGIPVSTTENSSHWLREKIVSLFQPFKYFIGYRKKYLQLDFYRKNYARCVT